VNYDTPTFAEDYIHRIGRTGRATLKGDALTFVSREEQKHLKKIEHFVEKRYELKRYPSFDYTTRPEPPIRHEHRDQRRNGHAHPTASNGNASQQRHHSPSGPKSWSHSKTDRHKRRVRQEFSGSVNPKTDQENNWRKLVEKMPEERPSLRKKLRRMFSKG